MADSIRTTTTQKDVTDAFPHGVIVIQPDRDLQYALVGLDVKDREGSTYLLGWAFPNKDMLFKLDKVTVRPDGWVIDADGGQYLFKPLDADSEKKILNSMAEM